MNKVSGNPIPTDKLVYRLRLMASSGGMLTRDRLKVLTEAADRLEFFDTSFTEMTKKNHGGDADEIN